MQAALLVGTKRPLVVEEVALDPPGPGEVHVKVVASGVCHSCLHSIDGTGGDSPFPMVLGDEGAGIVQRVGEGVTGLRAGDHVILSWATLCGACESCLTGTPATCARQPPFGFMRDGTVRMHRENGEDVHHFGTVSSYASEVVVPADCAIRIREDMPLEAAALIGCAITTGVGSVINTARVRPGTSVAVFGCGGIGLSAVMGAVLAGANPIIAVDIKPEKLELAKQIGATHGVLASDPDAVATIRDISHGGARTAILGVGFESVVQQAWASLAPRGTAVMIPFMGLDARLTIDPLPLIRYENRLIGSRYGSASPALEFPRLVELYMAGRLPIDAIISQRYPLADINEAHRALAAGENARGVIIFN
jgi:Zn-dependent alcohol dehydrogenase